jgi:hypothetical protein
MRWAGHIGLMGQPRNAYRILVGKSEGKRTFGGLMSKQDNISKDLKEKGSDGWTGFMWLSFGDGGGLL